VARSSGPNPATRAPDTAKEWIMGKDIKAPAADLPTGFVEDVQEDV
jgi:hypothetical protein